MYRLTQNGTGSDKQTQDANPNFSIRGYSPRELFPKKSVVGCFNTWLGKYLVFYISYMTLKQFYAIGIIFPISQWLKLRLKEVNSSNDIQ